MARLIDYLLNDRRAPKQEFVSLIDAQYIGIDNVARYYYESEQWFGFRDFPNVAPPFENIFMDFRGAKRFFDYRTRTVESIDNDNEWLGVHLAATDRQSFLNMARGYGHQQKLSDLLADESVKWVLLARPHGLNRRGIFLDIAGCWVLPVKDDGGVVVDVVDGVEQIHGIGDWECEHAQSIHNPLTFLAPVMLSLSFMHCKNVTLEPQTPPAALSKKFEKHHGRPLVRYHVLNIEPMKKVLLTKGQSEKTGLKMALHICRGHFKDYSKGGGLFGRYKGLYWWDNQVRGRVEQGIVDKDYRVKEPQP